MPISEEIRNKLREFSHNNKHDEIVTYLREQLSKEATTAQEIFDYARDYTFSKKPGKPYVIDAGTLNKLGVVVSDLDDADQNKLAVEFYRLSAERDSSWGNRNYAMCLLNGTHGIAIKPKKALEYARKAVDLTKANPIEKHVHKFILCKALRENQKWQEANTVLMEYLVHKEQQLKSEKTQENKQKITHEIQKVIQLCKKIVEEFCNDFLEEHVAELTEERCASNLMEIAPILTCNAAYEEFLLIKQNLYFIQGMCHEYLGENSEAWFSYCAVKNKKAERYNDAIIARTTLLKKQIDSIVDEDMAPAVAALAIENHDAGVQNQIEENSSNLILHQNVSLPVNFGKSWKVEAPWFHSVETNILQAEYNSRVEQVEKMIAAKEAEVSIYEEVCKTVTDNPSLAKKESLKKELKDLSDLQEKLEKKYTQYTPEYRKTFRRHTSESYFFNPNRSKKKQEIAELAKNIVDHRYKSNNAALPAIDLTGKSGRLFISAERAYQEAVTCLSGSKTPNLGIPIVPENSKPWTIGYNSGITTYGAIERYQVGGTTMKSEHRTSPKRQRLGDSFLPEHGTYSNDIYPFLSKLSEGETEKEKQLATLMIRYGKNHQAVTLDELKNICEGADEDDVHHFHRVCFLLMEKEQAQWHSATDTDYHLGMSVGQARCLIMVEAGFIDFKEAFKNNVLFGVYSCTELVAQPSKVATACKYIDKLYLAYLQSQRAHEHLKFFKKYIKEDHMRTCVLTREQARLDMQHVYGGESDSDHEGYDTDLSM